MQKDTLERLASEKNNPSISISMNTHRTHPDCVQDTIELKKLLKESQERIISEFGRRATSDLLTKMETLEKEFDPNYSLDSLHIFLSESTTEVIKSPWPIPQNSVHVGEKFSVKPLIKLLNRTENYMILLLSQSGVTLFHAINDSILEEIRNDDFPFTKNLHYLTHHDKLSDPKQVDNMVREFLNKVDKAAVKAYIEYNMHCVVICTEDNYSRLMQVADKPAIYYGHVPVNYNDVANHSIAAQAWNIVSAIQKQHRADDIKNMQEAVGQGKVLTDLAEIFRAAKEGRGELLITHEDFHQAVKMTGEYTFDLVDDAAQPEIIDDISDEIAREVIAKKGRAIFTGQEEIKSLGNIVLKTRY